MSSRTAPFLILSDATVLQAMRQLEDTAQKILFVVETSGGLVGSLTDGDIRRWILAGGDLDHAVRAVCNPEPHSVGTGYDLTVVRRLMIHEAIGCVPVVAKDGHVVDLLFWEAVFTDGSEHKPARPIGIPIVIMAGGRGTRLDPFTRVLPKPLIPLGDKTVIERIIDSFLRFGVTTFYLSVHSKAKIIKSYFEELDPDYDVKYIEEDHPMGTAGSLQYLGDSLQGPFVVTNCDIILEMDYAELLDFHREGGNDMTIVGSLKNYRIPYGVCEISEGGRLLGITEKPEYNFLVNTGLYVLEAETLGLIPERNSFNMTDLVDRVRENGGRVAVYPVSEKAWLDTGEWAEYRTALSQFEVEP